MSALRQAQNDVDALEDCWEHVGAAARRSLSNLEELIADLRAMEAIEGGPIQPAEVPGAGGDC